MIMRIILNFPENRSLTKLRQWRIIAYNRTKPAVWHAIQNGVQTVSDDYHERTEVLNGKFKEDLAPYRPVNFT